MLQQIVQTSLSLAGGAAYGASLANMATQANSLSGSMRGVISLSSPMRAALGALGGALSLGYITELGSRFENTQNKMAGFLTALGQSSNFAEGLQLADVVMRKIEITAARLPGEAQDYVTVFSQGLPQIQRAVGGTLDTMLEFSNRATAIGSTFQIDSRQMSHDLQRMLAVGKGLAGLDVRFFTEMLPFLQQVEGQANLNTEAFNKMTNVERAQLLEKAFSKLDPMIENAAQSWDAMRGAILTTGKTITRLSTQPLFDGMKHGLAEVNSAFYDINGNATSLTNNIVDIGRTISVYMVAGVGRVVDGIRWLSDHGVGLLEDVFSARFGAIEDFRALLNVNQGGSGFANIFDPLATSIDWVASGMMSLGGALSSVWDVVQRVAGIYEGVYLTVLPAVGEAFFIVSQAIDYVVTSMFSLVSDGIDMMLPHIVVFAQGIADLVLGIGSFLYPAIRIAGEVLFWLGTQIKDYVLPVVNFFIFVLGKAASAVGKFLGALGENASEFYGWNRAMNPRTQTADAIGDFFGNIMKTLADQRKRREAEDTAKGNVATNGKKPPAARGGTTVNQDFRFSKFTIDQRFSEGYDPERIAVMFARDIGRMGTQKLQSGFEPLFALRG